MAVSATLKLGVVASCCIGIAQHDLGLSRGFMDSILKAFTMQSNIWIAAGCLVFLTFEIAQRGARRVPAWLHALKFMFTTSALLTWIVFAVLLAPTMNRAYLLSPSNLCLHNLTPALALLDQINLDADSPMAAKRLWLTLIMPLLYTVAFFMAYEITGELPVPYFFLDYRAYGWFGVGPDGIGVLYWIALLGAVLIGIGAAVRRLQAAAQRRPLATSAIAVLAMMGGSAASGALGIRSVVPPD